MSTSMHAVDDAIERGYEYGFVTEIDSDTVPPGPVNVTNRCAASWCFSPVNSLARPTSDNNSSGKFVWIFKTVPPSCQLISGVACHVAPDSRFPLRLLKRAFGICHGETKPTYCQYLQSPIQLKP